MGVCLSDVFWDGFDAYKAGRSYEENPYKKEPARSEWEHGWRCGDEDTQLNEEDDLRPY